MTCQALYNHHQYCNYHKCQCKWERMRGRKKAERESACMLERGGGKDRKERENRMKEWILSETDKEREIEIEREREERQRKREKRTKSGLKEEERMK